MGTMYFIMVEMFIMFSCSIYVMVTTGLSPNDKIFICHFSARCLGSTIRANEKNYCSFWTRLSYRLLSFNKIVKFVYGLDRSVVQPNQLHFDKSNLLICQLINALSFTKKTKQIDTSSTHYQYTHVCIPLAYRVSKLPSE
jgi:hypothetical protein